MINAERRIELYKQVDDLAAQEYLGLPSTTSEIKITHSELRYLLDATKSDSPFTLDFDDGKFSVGLKED